MFKGFVKHDLHMSVPVLTDIRILIFLLYLYFYAIKNDIAFI